MEGQKINQSKLVRTNSSLIRSNPPLKISIHNLSSINEQQKTQDLEEQKVHGKNPVQPGSTRLTPVLALLLLSVYTLFAFFNRDEISISENLLLALVFVAILLFFVSRNKSFVDVYGKRLSLFSFKSKNGSKPVRWLIGEADFDENGGCNLKRIVKEGVEFYNNGDFYEGEFDKGKCNGSGMYSYFVNGKYEGEWIDGKYDGFGIESWARGSSYKGQYRQGLRHGFGVYKFYTGDSYAGVWCNGQSHGVGVQSCGDGSCFVGEFKCGVKHGLGCYHFRNGDRYGGEYFGDRVHGFGVYNFANGHRYEGAWHEGLKQGYGIYTFRNGIAKCGEWNGGNLTTSISPESNAVVRALQAARKTAENATQVRRVDEQVNKAVMAANRAATAARVAAVKAVQNQIDGKLFRH